MHIIPENTIHFLGPSIQVPWINFAYEEHISIVSSTVSHWYRVVFLQCTIQTCTSEKPNGQIKLDLDTSEHFSDYLLASRNLTED